MINRFLVFVAIVGSIISIQRAAGQEPQRNPLKEAEEIIKNLVMPPSKSIQVRYLQEIVKKTPNLAGTVWRTSVDSDEYTFSTDGKVQGVFLITGLSSGRGTFTQRDDSFEIRWSGKHVWRGTVLSENEITYLSDDGFGNISQGLKLKRKR